MYHEFTPCAALVPFIDKFWVFKGFTDIGTRFKILADGCTDFIFSIGNMTVPTDEHSMIMQPYRSYFVGPMRVYSDLTATTNTLHMLGVRFHPCGLAAFTNEPLGQFADLRIQSSDINLLFLCRDAVRTAGRFRPYPHYRRLSYTPSHPIHSSRQTNYIRHLIYKTVLRTATRTKLDRQDLHLPAAFPT